MKMIKLKQNLQRGNIIICILAEFSSQTSIDGHSHGDGKRARWNEGGGSVVKMEEG